MDTKTPATLDGPVNTFVGCFCLFLLILIPFAAKNGMPVDPIMFFLGMSGVSVLAVLIIAALGIARRLSIASTVVGGGLMLACAVGCLFTAAAASAAV